MKPVSFRWREGAALWVLILFCACQPTATDQNNSTASSGNAAPIQPIEAPSAEYASDKKGWLVHLDEAYAQSVKEGKPILANFTGSDWCGWCKRLDADVFSTPVFQTWAAKNVVLLEVDFPKRKQLPPKNKEQNDAMAQSLGISGFPTVWILQVERDAANARFKIVPIGKTGYAKTPEEFIGVLSQYVNLAGKKK